MQTVASFAEKLEKLCGKTRDNLIEVFAYAISALTTISEANGIYQTAFGNLRLRPKRTSAPPLIGMGYEE